MNRFFNEENASIASESAHQVLGPLEYKIPAEVGKANQIGLV
jgi:hypothetical protein